MNLVARFSLTLLLTAAGVAPATAQYIEISDRPEGGYPNEACVPIGGTWTLYILARPGGAMPDGITGAEFYVAGLPEGWFAISVPNPANVGELGDPFSTASPFRADIVFACTPEDENGVILLYTVTVIPTTAVVNRALRVWVADPPTNAVFTTPILWGCDLEPRPASGSEFWMNPQDRTCPLAVESASWGGLKQLYRE